MKYYQVDIPSQKPVFTNSKKIKKQLEENAKKFMEENAIRVSWDENIPIPNEGEKKQEIDD